MTAQPINLHSWPGRVVDKARAPVAGRRRAYAVERLADRPGVVLAAAAERHAVPERWGLGLALLVVGSTVAGAELVVDDGLADRDPAAFAAVETWAVSTIMPTPEGPAPVRVVTRSGLCDPDAGTILRTYTGGTYLLTADEGRSLGLLGQEPPSGRPWPAARGRFRGGFTIGLPGWGEYGTRADARDRKCFRWWPKLHRPPLRVKALGAHGIMAEWGRAGRSGFTLDGEPAGHWEAGRPFLGRIVDLIGPAHACDGIDTGNLGDHLGAFGLPCLDLPAAVVVGPDAAAHLLDVALAVHRLALVLGDETTGALRRTFSPGSPAAAMFTRAGVTPPLRKFAVPGDSALTDWAATEHGGECTATLRGAVVPVVDADMRQAYVAAWCVVGGWQVLTARSLRRVDRTGELRALAARAAAGNLTPLYDRDTYTLFGLALAHVLPDGEPWPVERPGPRGPRFDVAPLRSDTPLPMAWADVVDTAARSGRVPRIVSATGLVPIGTEPGLRPVPLWDGTVVDAGCDPLAPLARSRPAKGTGQDRQRARVRGIANPAAWGIFARLDQERVGGRLREHPATWTWPPLAATGPAIVRLWLGMVRRQVADLGGAVVACDTDGLAVVASPEGGAVPTADGRLLRALSWSDVDGILAPFDCLDAFDDGGAFWSVDREHEGRSLHMLSLAPKRYVLAVRDDDDCYRAVGGTEHSLGGGVVGPDGDARDADRRHLWTFPVAQQALDLAAGIVAGWAAPWDVPGAPGFPVLRRFTAGSPDAVADLPASLGAHPFAVLVEGQVDKLYGEHLAPVALDPGTDLADWGGLDWRDTDEAPVRVTVGSPSTSGIALRELGEWAVRWCDPVPPEPVGIVDVDPRLIRRVGRGGALIDALLVDPTARPEDHQVTYDVGDDPAFVADLVRRMGRKPFAVAFDLPFFTVRDIARGARADAVTTATVLDALASGRVVPGTCPVDGEAVWRAGARYCSPRCRETAKARRRRSGPAVARPCAAPGCPHAVTGRPDKRTCSAACKKRRQRGARTNPTGKETP